MRASISPSGSLMLMSLVLPARLDHAGDETLASEVAQRDSRHAQLAVITAGTPGEIATVANPRGRRIARQFGELETGGEPFLGRQGPGGGDRLEPRPPRLVLLGEAAALLVPLDHARLGHSSPPVAAASSSCGTESSNL